MNFKTIIRIALPFLLALYLVGMLYIATSSNLPDVERIRNADKYVHMIEFFIFTLLLLATLEIYGFRDFYLLSLGIILLLVVLSEMIQIPLHNRTFSVADMMADLIGVSVGFALLYVVNKKWNLLKRLY